MQTTAATAAKDRTPVLRRLTLLAALALFFSPCHAQSGIEITGPLPISPPIPGRLIVVYRRPMLPSGADAIARSTRAETFHHLAHLGMTTLSIPASDEPLAIAQLAHNPQVAFVLHDRYVAGHALLLRRAPLVTALDAAPPGAPAYGRRSILRKPLKPSMNVGAGAAMSQNSAPGAPGTLPSGPQSTSMPSTPPPAASLYNSPQGWAVRGAGGYGNNIPGGPATGPWSTTLGAGVRIAILDSGVDENHPAIAPNLVLNLSEVNQAALPSSCDDGSPQDQSGHGTWTASLAAGALTPATSPNARQVLGVAPQATILNIKVLERMPASGISDPAAACEAGQPGGLLSWVLQGIDDAVANHADIIALSLGTLVDTSTGEGAGLKSAFDQATFAATQSGAVVIAALGNDGLNLSTGALVELPAQARNVLPITASTNPGCAENLAAGATCAPGQITRPYYSNYDPAANAVAAPGGSYPEGATINLPATTTAVSTAPTVGATGWITAACSSGLTNTMDGLPANGRSFGCFNLGHNAYVQAMGTSASAALAAGAAAILRAARPDLSAAQIVETLRSSATSVPTMAEPELNLAAALSTP